MRTRVSLNITTGYHVLNSGSVVNLFVSRYVEKKKSKHRMKQQQSESLLYGCEMTSECF